MNFLVTLLFFASVALAQPTASWKGALLDAAGKPLANATLELRGPATLRAVTAADGTFAFPAIPPGRYTLGALALTFDSGVSRTQSLRRDGDAYSLLALTPEAAGGEQLTARQVTALPLNKRDFSQLLLLASGTRTDTNGAANFTQQFTINGQRGVAAVFSMDGGDIADPEMGGATFSNFNVDAIQEINGSAGVMPAAIGQGAAGFTEIVTKSGINDLHGSLFEFVRNAAFDARNFFDRQSLAQPGRIPPFARNEFGVSSGGPLRRDRTFFFLQYQGFRQVLGTTQVLSVPTPAEREGRDSTAYPGDVLTIPVDSRMAAVVARYPLPNDSTGPYGERTYAISSKIHTVSDQFSVRIDHKLSDKARLNGRFSLNNIEGPITNPNQTAIDPTFAIPYFDHQRSAVLNYERTLSPTATSQTTLAFIRATPNFPTINSTQPALTFGDSLYENFNTAAGSIIASYGNLFQLRQNFSWTWGAHTWKFGGELRVQRDSTYFGTAPNGTYTFGGGTAYSPVEIRSRSGQHDIHVGDPLPDSLSGLLTATPFAYTVTAAPLLFAQGDHMGDSAVRRDALNFYLQDTWKVTPAFTLNYGLRYEINSRIKEGRRRTSGLTFDSTEAHFLINRQPAYELDKNGWGPRLALDYRVQERTLFRAGGAITTLLPNVWQDNSVTGSLPYVVAPLITAAQGNPIPFRSAASPIALPQVYDIAGRLVYTTGNSMDVPANTEMDVLRYERDLAALSPDKQVRPVAVGSMAPDFRNGYIATWTAGVERSVAGLTASADYVATAGIHLPRMEYPNGYAGAEPSWAPYSLYGPITIVASNSHSSFHSLQMAASKNSLRGGLGFQASYTFSKSIDDSSTVLGVAPQNPRNYRGEKAPSSFDVTHGFSLSAIQQLPFGKGRVRAGWQLIAMAALSTGSPFSILSGIQQTAAGSTGADRPDKIGQPALSTSRTVREDYFGLGAANPSFFSLPRGRFGSLGRNTFRGPGYHALDLSLTKDTPVGRVSNPERAILQFRFEVFNALNAVNFGLPSNTVLGPGFGVVSKTAGPSRQIQLSLKLLW